MAATAFSGLLVANRGEIALRILSTAKRLGLRTAAVFQESDRDGPAVAFADVAIEITGSSPVAAYLDGPQVI